MDLLLVHADDCAPVLGVSLPEEAALVAPKPRLNQPDHLLNRSGDPDDLVQQRWGVVIPSTPEGERLLALIEPLRKLRQEEQGGEPVEIYRVPPGMTDIETIDWRRSTFEDQDKGQESWPGYLVILGDLDGVSLEFQQVMGADLMVGRIAFPGPEGYEAYVAKVLRWHRQPYADTKARALLYTVHDGTGATSNGYSALMKPSLERCRRRLDQQVFAAKEILEIGSPGKPSAAELLEQVRRPEPAVLFSMSHGLGVPRAGWSSTDEQRALQGAMSFGRRQRLAGADVASGPFLPGGIWFFLACYGAGTPKSSAYLQWMTRLRDAGHYTGSVEPILASLPKEGDRPFLAALPQAVLANPEGPLAVMAHVDIAWTYSFQDVDGAGADRPERFQGIFRSLLDRKRVGTAYQELARFGTQAAVDLATRYNRDGEGQPSKSADPARANLWMLRHDLLGYILLGDPAVRLPLTSPAARSRDAGSPSPSLQQQASFALGFQVQMAPEPKLGTGSVDAQTMDKAVRAVLRESETPRAIAQRLGVDKRDLERWVEAYTSAGRAALEKLR